MDADKQEEVSTDSTLDSQQVDASTVALGSALAEAAEQVVQDLNAGPGSAEPPNRFKRVRRGAWTQLDRILALVLGMNILFMALMVFVPWPEDATTVNPGEEPVVGGVDPGKKEVKDGKGQLAPRNPLYSQAEKLYAQGKKKEAVAILESLLQEEPDLHDSVRRAIYMRLAYYCGDAGLIKKSTTYRLLAQAGLLRGLLPEEVWNMAKEAHRVRDYPLARRYAARFLLQEGLMAEREKKIKPLAYLRLADGYRLQADKKPLKEPK